MKRLDVAPPHDHPVWIGRGLRAPKPRGPVALIFDPNVAPLARRLEDAARPQIVLELAGGESSKRLAVFERVLRELARAGLPRDAEVWAVGGGTITDLAGFVAASYLRGVAWRAWPTTTLAVVDAAVGGKTGGNLPEGKNLVGAFHPPRGVYAELEALAGLPEATFREGLVEAFKHGLIAGDPTLLAPWELTPDHPELEPYLARAVAVKIAVVERDFRESGERMKLNLGHTLAHALEAASGHALAHGHAVAWGLLFAALLGRELGGDDLTEPVLRLLAWTRAPAPPAGGWDDFADYIARDKKSRQDGLRWVVPYAAGDVRVEAVAEPALRAAFTAWRDRATGYPG